MRAGGAELSHEPPVRGRTSSSTFWAYQAGLARKVVRLRPLGVVKG